MLISSSSLQRKFLIKEYLVDLVVEHLHVIIVSLVEKSTHFLLSGVKVTTGDAEIAEKTVLARPDTYLCVTEDQEILVVNHTPDQTGVLGVFIGIVLSSIEEVCLARVERKQYGLLSHRGILADHSRIVAGQ